MTFCIHHELGSTGMYDLMVILLYLLTLHTFNLYALQLDTHQFVFIKIKYFEIVCFKDVVMFNLCMSNLYAFNLYAFLSSICIYLIYLLSMCMLRHLGQDVFKQTDQQPWPFLTLKKLFALLDIQGKVQ